MKYFRNVRTKKISANLWTLRWWSGLDMYDVNYMLAVDYCDFGVKVKASNIPNDSVRYGVFQVGRLVMER